MIVCIIWFPLVWIEWVICFQAWHSAFPLHGWSHLRSPNKRASSFSLPSKYTFALNEGMKRHNSQVNECQSKSQPWCVFFPSLPDLATSSLSLSKQLSFSDCKKKERKKKKNGILSWREQPSLGWWGPAMGSNYRKMPADRLIPWEVRLSWSSGTL